MNPSNPNGANQYQLDPRQKLCWDFYIDPKSETFSNITQSAIRAGYTEGYADGVGVSDWFYAKLWKLNSVNSSEKVFRDILESNHNDPDTGKIDSGVLRIKADIAKFLASTQGKNEGYSTKGDDAQEKLADRVNLNDPSLIAAMEIYRNKEKELL